MVKKVKNEVKLKIYVILFSGLNGESVFQESVTMIFPCNNVCLMARGIFIALLKIK